MDVWLLCPLGAAQPQTAPRIKGGSFLFKASATAADIRGALGSITSGI